MSLRRLSIDAGHHAFPQPPVAANPVKLRPQDREQYDSRSIESSDEDADPMSPLARSERAERPPPGELVSTGIWWAYFTLGAVMLLGWNGVSLPPSSRVGR